LHALRLVCGDWLARRGEEQPVAASRKGRETTGEDTIERDSTGRGGAGAG